MVDKLKQLESEIQSIEWIEDLPNLQKIFSTFEYLMRENQKQFPRVLGYALFEELRKTESDLKMARKHKKSKDGVVSFEYALGHLKDDIKYVIDGIERYDS